MLRLRLGDWGLRGILFMFRLWLDSGRLLFLLFRFRLGGRLSLVFLDGRPGLGSFRFNLGLGLGGFGGRRFLVFLGRRFRFGCRFFLLLGFGHLAFFRCRGGVVFLDGRFRFVLVGRGRF